ncbi:MAG: Fic family protein [Capsulimonas sp.]|nr:Fic family protein [Capsulimonas sp.]
MDKQVSSLKISPAVLKLIGNIDEFKGSWRAMRNLAPERLAALRRVATIESIGSSTRIEGARLSDREVERLLAGLSTHSFGSRDEEEVAGYAEVMEIIFSSWETIPFTENYIKQLHQLLLKYSSKDVRHRGEYKKLANHVEAFDEDGRSAGVIFQTASPFDTPARMMDLVAWTSEMLETQSLHPLLVIAVFVVCFLEIHPFQDGNGRLSRILTTLLLMRSGYSYAPYSSLESVIELSKDSYYLALRRTQRTLSEAEPDWEPWVQFFLHAMQRQKDRLEAKIARERVWNTALPILSIQILELAAEHGRITTSQIETITGEHRSTIKSRLTDLMSSGYLLRHGQGRSTWYALS